MALCQVGVLCKPAAALPQILVVLSPALSVLTLHQGFPAGAANLQARQGICWTPSAQRAANHLRPER